MEKIIVGLVVMFFMTLPAQAEDAAVFPNEYQPGVGEYVLSCVPQEKLELILGQTVPVSSKTGMVTNCSYLPYGFLKKPGVFVKKMDVDCVNSFCTVGVYRVKLCGQTMHFASRWIDHFDLDVRIETLDPFLPIGVPGGLQACPRKEKEYFHKEKMFASVNE